MSVFPVFLKLAGRRVLVVGGGPVAASKLRALLEADAHVTVVAPDIVPDIAGQRSSGCSGASRRRTSTACASSWPRRRPR